MILYQCTACQYQPSVGEVILDYRGELKCPLCGQHVVKHAGPQEYKHPERKSGGSNNYYRVSVNEPTSDNIAPYVAECNDIIEALDLRSAEANVLKAIWRIAAWRKGWQDKHQPEYDSEKIQFFSRRIRILNGGNNV